MSVPQNITVHCFLTCWNVNTSFESCVVVALHARDLPSRPSGNVNVHRHGPIHQLLSFVLLSHLDGFGSGVGKSRGQPARPQRQAVQRVLLQLVRGDRDGPCVPQHPPHEAQEHHDGARVDEKVAVKAVVHAKVGESADEQHGQADHVKSHAKHK